MRIKSADSISKKFASRGQAAAPDYTEGVKAPRRDWAESTSAAKDTYAQGVQGAISNNSFQKGVEKAGNEKWQRKASSVGSQRYGQGVAAAAGDYQKGVSPYLETLSGLTLPPRYPKGDPRNNARVNAITEALRAKKISG